MHYVLDVSGDTYTTLIRKTGASSSLPSGEARLLRLCGAARASQPACQCRGLKNVRPSVQLQPDRHHGTTATYPDHRHSCPPSPPSSCHHLASPTTPALPHSLHPPEFMQKVPALHELPFTVPHAETSIGTETSKPKTSLPGHLLRERRDRVGLDLAAVSRFERALLGERLPVAAARTRDYGEGTRSGIPTRVLKPGHAGK
jgi:hypothetical protein